MKQECLKMKFAVLSSLSLALLVSLALAPGIWTAEAKGPKMISGQVSEQKVDKLLSGIHWYESLPQAEAVAKQQGKPIVWVHMLGKMDGAT